MFRVYAIFVITRTSPSHKNLIVMNGVIVFVKVTAPSQTSFIGVPNYVFNFHATTLTKFILSSLSWQVAVDSAARTTSL